MTVCPLLAAPHLVPLALASACASAPRIDLRLGFDEGGAATPEWRAAVETHTGTKPAWEPRALTAEERSFVTSGSAGVLALARRHLPPELAARLPRAPGS